MTAKPSSEFNHAGAPPEAWKRHHLYLAEQDSGSVLTDGMKAAATSGNQDRKNGNGVADAFETQMMIQASRLADPAYQAMSARINGDLDRMDTEAVEALQNIEHELLALRRESEQLLEQAYRDEQGRAVAMTEDGTAAYYITDDGIGERLDEEEFLRIRSNLTDKPAMEAYERNNEAVDELNAAREAIHDQQAEGDRLREDLDAGRVSQGEAEQRAQDIQETMGATLSDAELAILGARGGPEADDPAPDARAGEVASPTAPLTPH